jgi:hypothetical protein
MAEPDGRLLRAKYLDWCSARVAERFLDLSAEEIYALAHPRESESGDSPAELPAPGHESYRVLVQRATDALLSEMSLPPFEEWRREYEASPERFNAEMLGFWRDPNGYA